MKYSVRSLNQRVKTQAHNMEPLTVNYSSKRKRHVKVDNIYL